MVLLIIVRLRHLQNIYVHVYVSSVLEQNMYKTGTKLISFSQKPIYFPDTFCIQTTQNTLQRYITIYCYSLAVSDAHVT